MKKISKLSTLFLFLAVSLLTGCKKDGSSDSGNNFSMKVNGTSWSGTGAATMNDLSQGGTTGATFLTTAYKSDGDPNNPEFALTLRGINIQNGKVIAFNGGWNNGEHIALTYNGTDYSTQDAPSSNTVGTMTIQSVGGTVKATFSGVLYNAAGASINLSEGSFEVPLQHF